MRTIIQVGQNLAIVRQLGFNGWHSVFFLRSNIAAHGLLPAGVTTGQLAVLEETTLALEKRLFEHPEITAAQFIVSFWQEAFSASFLAGFVCMRFSIPAEVAVYLVHYLPKPHRN